MEYLVDEPDKVCEKIDELLKKKGMSRRELAERIGMPPSTLQSILDEKRDFKLTTWWKIVHVLNEDHFGNAAEMVFRAQEEHKRMLIYAIAGCRRLLWETAFDLNKPALTATQAQDIVYNLGQMANDLDSYEAEAERMGLGK